MEKFWKEEYKAIVQENCRMAGRITKLRTAVRENMNPALADEVLERDDMMAQDRIPGSIVLQKDRSVVIDYTNWRNVGGVRSILPFHLWFGQTEYHKEPQWMVRALDLEKEENRDFALRSVHSWK